MPNRGLQVTNSNLVNCTTGRSAGLALALADEVID
jgi:hypothetical protein